MDVKNFFVKLAKYHKILKKIMEEFFNLLLFYPS